MPYGLQVNCSHTVFCLIGKFAYKIKIPPGGVRTAA